jgi:hemolysin D
MNTVRYYFSTIRRALATERERVRKHQPSAQSEFLPAALEVIERPVSPTGRRTAQVLLGLLVVTMAWLFFGHVDVVASAPGLILQSGASKQVQSAGTGVVAGIYVRDGDHVKKGQILIDLDTTLAGAELEQAQRALLDDRIEIEHDRALVAALDGRGIHFAAPPGTPEDIRLTQERLIAAQLHELESTVAGYRAARQSAQSDLQSAMATRDKLSATLPLLQRELDAMNVLDAKGYAPGMRLLELQRQYRSEQGERAVAEAQIAHGASEARKYGSSMVEARDTLRRQTMAEMAKAQGDAIVRQEDVAKAARRAGLQHITAPADGTVQQLAIHTVGGVVEPVRSLMVVVPEQDDIEVEAKILNKDIGFVREGQTVAVKVDAFPFTRYGSVPGIIKTINRDAVSDRQLGAVYITRIRLQRGTIIADGKPIPLTAGLGVTADILTGKRRIISWLISPITTTISQAAREK